MTCISTAAMALFLNIISVPVTNTEHGLIIHATDGPVEYIRTDEGFCFERRTVNEM